MKTIVWLSEAADDAPMLGGKANSLRTLFRRGLPVPNGFVIPSSARPAGGEVSAEFEHELLAAFDKLGSPKVAVRSSAAGEDGGEDSWAGQFETYLDIEKSGLLEAVQKCWDSVSNERSQAYAGARGLSEETLISVVVQAMVPRELAGVMFSRDPRGINSDSIVIEAARGVGEKLVQGEVDPDGYEVNRDDLKIISRSLQAKVALVNDGQLAELARYALQIETLFGNPQDIEWAMVDGKIFILQARPITTLEATAMAGRIPNWQDQLLFRWGPVPGELYYMNDYADAIIDIVQADKIASFPEFIVTFRNSEVLWVCEQAKMTAMGKGLFLEQLHNPKSVEKWHEEYDKALVKKQGFEANLAGTSLKDLEKVEVAELLWQYYEILMNFWRPTIATELSNYGSSEVLNEMLAKSISDPKQLAKVANLLLLPEDYTYSQLEEFELAKTRDVQAHAKKYSWLLNSYAGPKTLDEEFFLERKSKLSKDIKEEAGAALEKQELAKRAAIFEYGLSDEAQLAAKMIVEAMLWQDGRKAKFLQSVEWKGKLLERAAELLGEPIERLRQLPVKTVVGRLSGDEAETFIGYLIKGEDVTYLNQTQNDLSWELYAYHNLRQTMDGVQGVVAARGRQLITHGAAVIVLDPKTKVDFPEGSILVAQMTTPDYIFYMRKAAALVTDTGGITSHAAIVSRELNLPCIVGTKNASSLFKTGDLLQINTLHGTALRMKKAQ